MSKKFLPEQKEDFLEKIKQIWQYPQAKNENEIKNLLPIDLKSWQKIKSQRSKEIENFHQCSLEYRSQTLDKSYHAQIKDLILETEQQINSIRQQGCVTFAKKALNKTNFRNAYTSPYIFHAEFGISNAHTEQLRTIKLLAVDKSSYQTFSHINSIASGLSFIRRMMSNNQGNNSKLWNSDCLDIDTPSQQITESAQWISRKIKNFSDQKYLPRESELRELLYQFLDLSSLCLSEMLLAKSKHHPDYITNLIISLRNWYDLHLNDPEAIIETILQLIQSVHSIRSHDTLPYLASSLGIDWRVTSEAVSLEAPTWRQRLSNIGASTIRAFTLGLYTTAITSDTLFSGSQKAAEKLKFRMRYHTQESWLRAKLPQGMLREHDRWDISLSPDFTGECLQKDLDTLHDFPWNKTTDFPDTITTCLSLKKLPRLITDTRTGFRNTDLVRYTQITYNQLIAAYPDNERATQMARQYAQWPLKQSSLIPKSSPQKINSKQDYTASHTKHSHLPTPSTETDYRSIPAKTLEAVLNFLNQFSLIPTVGANSVLPRNKRQIGSPIPTHQDAAEAMKYFWENDSVFNRNFPEARFLEAVKEARTNGVHSDKSKTYLKAFMESFLNEQGEFSTQATGYTFQEKFGRMQASLYSESIFFKNSFDNFEQHAPRLALNDPKRDSATLLVPKDYPAGHPKVRDVAAAYWMTMNVYAGEEVYPVKVLTGVMMSQRARMRANFRRGKAAQFQKLQQTWAAQESSTLQSRPPVYFSQQEFIYGRFITSDRSRGHCSGFGLLLSAAMRTGGIERMEYTAKVLQNIGMQGFSEKDLVSDSMTLRLKDLNEYGNILVSQPGSDRTVTIGGITYRPKEVIPLQTLIDHAEDFPLGHYDMTFPLEGKDYAHATLFIVDIDPISSNRRYTFFDSVIALCSSENPAQIFSTITELAQKRGSYFLSPQGDAFDVLGVALKPIPVDALQVPIAKDAPSVMEIASNPDLLRNPLKKATAKAPPSSSAARKFKRQMFDLSSEIDQAAGISKNPRLLGSITSPTADLDIDFFACANRLQKEIATVVRESGASSVFIIDTKSVLSALKEAGKRTTSKIRGKFSKITILIKKGSQQIQKEIQVKTEYFHHLNQRLQKYFPDAQDYAGISHGMKAVGDIMLLVSLVRSHSLIKALEHANPTEKAEIIFTLSSISVSTASAATNYANLGLTKVVTEFPEIASQVHSAQKVVSCAASKVNTAMGPIGMVTNAVQLGFSANRLANAKTSYQTISAALDVVSASVGFICSTIGTVLPALSFITSTIDFIVSSLISITQALLYEFIVKAYLIAAGYCKTEMEFDTVFEAMKRGIMRIRSGILQFEESLNVKHISISGTTIQAQADPDSLAIMPPTLYKIEKRFLEACKKSMPTFKVMKCLSEIDPKTGKNLDSSLSIGASDSLAILLPNPLPITYSLEEMTQYTDASAVQPYPLLLQLQTSCPDEQYINRKRGACIHRHESAWEIKGLQHLNKKVSFMGRQFVLPRSYPLYKNRHPFYR